MKILVNTISTKKQSGGAFQIAQNFIKATLQYKLDDIEWYYVSSADVDAQIGQLFEGQKGMTYFVFPTQPDFKGTYRQVKHQLKELEQKINPDVIYTISAPCYFSFQAPEVMRYTNPIVTTPNKYAKSVLTLKQRVRNFAYSIVQRAMMRRAKYFITQTQIVKEGIQRITKLPDEQVYVVSNVLPVTYKGVDTSHIDLNDGYVHVACIAAPVPHKNLEIIPMVLSKLNQIHSINNIKFHVTIPTDSPIWHNISKSSEKFGCGDRIVNHGRISQQELIDVYRNCNLCFFPTLLEVFSVTPLEAMFFNIPIVATDFGFNHEAIGDACLYFAPKDATDAAEKLANLIRDPKLYEDMQKRMERQLPKYGDYESHFLSTIGFLRKVHKMSNNNYNTSLNFE